MRNNLLTGTIPEIIGDVNFAGLFLGGNFFTGTMPFHNARLTDAPPGTNLTDLHPVGVVLEEYEDTPIREPFTGSDLKTLTFTLCATAVLLTAFLFLSYVVSARAADQKRNKKRMAQLGESGYRQEEKNVRTCNKDETLIPSLQC